MIIRNFCEKNLLSRGGEIIRYNICKNEGDGYSHYGIQITEQLGEIYNKETVEDISTSEIFVRDLLLYLFENSVDTVHFKDIIEDCLLKSENT